MYTQLRLLGFLWLFTVRAGWAQPLVDVERLIADETNQVRAENQAPPLTLDPFLSEIARGHSEEMLVQNYFGHDSPNQMCKTVRDRLRFGHRFCLTSAENLHKCQGYQPPQLARTAVSSWMESPGHRRNILNSHFNRVGIGVARRGDTFLFTQLFSYEPVIVTGLDVTAESGGFRVKVTAFIADGPLEGGWFVDGKRQSSWVADSGRIISVELFMQAGFLEIGQLVGNRLWDVETTIPIPPPELHLKHSWRGFPWLLGLHC